MPTHDKAGLAHRALVARVLEGDGEASPSMRHAAFSGAELAGPLGALMDKVALRPTSIADDDIAAVKASGLSEDQIFELVLCAAIGQSSRQYSTALTALAAATDEAETGHAT